MRISDWSSDVCSSDLKIYVRNKVVLQQLSHNGGSLRMKLGYARVSTEDQNLDIKCARLSAAGCEMMFDAKISGAAGGRIELAKLMGQDRKRVGNGKSV